MIQPNGDRLDRPVNSWMRIEIAPWLDSKELSVHKCYYFLPSRLAAGTVKIPAGTDAANDKPLV